MLRVGDETIEVKVNGSVQQRAFSLVESGIPVLCGVPVVSSLLDFQISSPCVWFRLIPFLEEYEDIYMGIDTRTLTISRSSRNEPFPTLRAQDILQLAKEAPPMVLSEAIERLKEIGRTHNVGMFSGCFWPGGNYKPVYLLLRTKERESW